jgi:hypothetical protein
VRAEVPEYLLPSPDDSCHEFNSSHFNVSEKNHPIENPREKEIFAERA